MPSPRLRLCPITSTLALAAAIGLLAGCESSGSPDTGASRSATITPAEQPADAGAAAELRLLSQTAAAPVLTREHLVGSVVAWRGSGGGWGVGGGGGGGGEGGSVALEGGFAAWAAQARAGRWLPDALLADPTKPVRAGEAARTLASLIAPAGSAGAAAGPTTETDAIAALREAGVIQRPVATGDPISGERWLAWFSAAKDLQSTSALAAGPPIATRPAPTKPTGAGEASEPRSTPRTAPTATAAATPPKGESFDEFDSTPAPPPPPPPTSGRADSGQSRPPPPSTPPSTRPAARTQGADQPTIPSARPEPLPARLDEVAETVVRRPGSSAAPADRRRAWTPGRPVQPNQPANPPKPGDPAQGAPR